ncbi:MAG: enoyl-CoA hydratase/isomerase family protein [Balneolaceae bacterium]|nr:enoyl-CoA hydratase/isomerase family protein [Balneolaceae bacterium]
MPLIRTEIHDRVLRATLDRPGSRNAVSFAVMDELEALLDRLEEDEDLRAFVLEGTGEAFISGGDLKEFHGLRTAEEGRAMARRMQRLLLRLEDLPCWTLAAVSGPAYGGGCEIALAFDFRMAAEGATFGFTQGKFYLPPGWGGLTRLVERVGRPTALRWLAGAEVVKASEALRCGLIDRLEPQEAFRETALAWAHSLTHNDRDYIGTLKQGALRCLPNRRESLEQELEAFGAFWEDDRHRERVQKFLDRREMP